MRLFAYARDLDRDLDRDLGVLTRVYNTNPGQLRDHMDVAMRTSKALIAHLTDLGILKRIGVLMYDSKRQIVATDDVIRSIYPTGDAPRNARRRETGSTPA